MALKSDFDMYLKRLKQLTFLFTLHWLVGMHPRNLHPATPPTLASFSEAFRQ